MSIVRSRCLRFIVGLEREGVRELPLSSVKELFMKTEGIFDDQSLISYFGQQQLKMKQVIQKTHKYHTGTISISNIEYSRALTVKKGYFEILDLATIEQRGQKLFFVIKPRSLVNDVKVRNFPPSPLLETVAKADECSVKHGADFSLSPIALSTEHSLSSLYGKEDENNEIIKEKKSYMGREKFDNSVIMEETIDSPLCDHPVKIRGQPSDEDLLELYEKTCKNGGKEVLQS